MNYDTPFFLYTPCFLFLLRQLAYFTSPPSSSLLVAPFGLLTCVSIYIYVMEGKGLRVFINDQSSQMLVIYKFLKNDVRNMNIVPPAKQPFFFLSLFLLFLAKQPPPLN